MFENSENRKDAFHHALNSLTENECAYASFDFFDAAEMTALIAQTDSLTFRSATKVVGNNVHQDMDVCFPAPRIGAFDKCASLLEQIIKSWSGFDQYILPDFHLNDFAAQRYPAGSQGIGIHKDGLRYKNLVIIITLSGQSRLFYTDKREGGERIKIDDSPGRIVLLKATGFGGNQDDIRALHGVDMIETGRLSLGFRFEPS